MQHVEILDEYQIHAAEDDSAVISAVEKNQATDADKNDPQQGSDDQLDLTNIDFIEQLENDPDSLLKELATIGQSAFVLQVLSSAAAHGNPVLVKQNLRDFIAHSQTRLEQLHTRDHTVEAKETAAIKQLQTRIISQPSLTALSFPTTEAAFNHEPQQIVAAEIPAEIRVEKNATETTEANAAVKTSVLSERITPVDEPVVPFAEINKPIIADKIESVSSVSKVETPPVQQQPLSPTVTKQSVAVDKDTPLAEEKSVPVEIGSDVALNDVVQPAVKTAARPTIVTEVADLSSPADKIETSVQQVADHPVLLETLSTPAQETVSVQKNESDIALAQEKTTVIAIENIPVNKSVDAAVQTSVIDDTTMLQDNFSDAKTIVSPVVFEPDIMVQLTKILQTATQEITTQEISPDNSLEQDVPATDELMVDTAPEFSIIESLLPQPKEPAPATRSALSVQETAPTALIEKTVVDNSAVEKTGAQRQTLSNESFDTASFEPVADVFLPEAEPRSPDQSAPKTISLLPLREAKPLPTMVAANFIEITSKETLAPNVLRPETLPMRRAYSTENDKPILSHFNQNIVEKITPQVKILDTVDEPIAHAEETLEQETPQPVMAASYMDPVAAYAALYGYAPAPTPAPKAEPAVVQMPGYNNQYRYAS